MHNEIELLIWKYNSSTESDQERVRSTLPKEVSICAFCAKAQLVPITSDVNFCTMEVNHHYGSPKDYQIETFSFCLDCYNKLIKTKPTSTRYQWK